jgi:hypothetical protein
MVEANCVIARVIRNAHIEDADAIIEHVEKEPFLTTEVARRRNPTKFG